MCCRSLGARAGHLGAGGRRPPRSAAVPVHRPSRRSRRPGVQPRRHQATTTVCACHGDPSLTRANGTRRRRQAGCVRRIHPRVAQLRRLPRGSRRTPNCRIPRRSRRSTARTCHADEVAKYQPASTRSARAQGKLPWPRPASTATACTTSAPSKRSAVAHVSPEHRRPRAARATATPRDQRRGTSRSAT